MLEAGTLELEMRVLSNSPCGCAFRMEIGKAFGSSRVTLVGTVTWWCTITSDARALQADR